MKRVALIGFGPGERGLLTVAACDELRQADVIVGSQRLLSLLPEGSAPRREPAVRDEEIAAFLQDAPAWENACIVLSGDVGIFSGAKRLYERLANYETVTIPGISSAQYFAAKLQQPWQDWRFASAHGIACNIASLVQAGRPLFLVTGGSNTVAWLCKQLMEAGLGQARVAVGERLSYVDERLTQGSAQELSEVEFDALSVMLIEISAEDAARMEEAVRVAGEAAATGAAPATTAPTATAPTTAAPAPLRSQQWPWATPGIPDERFVRGRVPMTKQEVRVVALAKLRIAPDDIVYDVGAGTGSVAVEAALLAREGHVYALERNEEALDLIRQNCQRFGIANVTVCAGLAPESLAGLPAPDAVFVGGSGKALREILAQVQVSNARVRVCIPCVTLETLSETLALLTEESFTQFEATQVAISRAEPAGSYHLLRAQNPVFIVSAQGVNHEL